MYLQGTHFQGSSVRQCGGNPCCNSREGSRSCCREHSQCASSCSVCTGQSQGTTDTGGGTTASLHVTTSSLQMCPKNIVTSDQIRSDLGQWRSRSREGPRTAQVSQESSGTNPTLCVPALSHSTLTLTQYIEALRYTGLVLQGR